MDARQNVNLVFRCLARMLNQPKVGAAIIRDTQWNTPRILARYSRRAIARLAAMSARLERPSNSLVVPLEKSTTGQLNLDSALTDK